MKETLYLHIPSYPELWYRQKIMQDPDTMRYNRGYDLPFDGYDKDTGCIPFPQEKWAEWYAYFVGQEPERFYAYIARKPDGAFIGEVNVHKNADAPWYEMGIVLQAQYRGKGYAGQALWLLLQYAFETLGAEAVHNDFEEERHAATRAHLSVGFTRYRQGDGILELMITREQYFREKAIRRMAAEIEAILAGCAPSIYLYGSAVLDDFRLGWSDLDILVLTKGQITGQQAGDLVLLRQRLQQEEPGNPYYRLFEGGMLPLEAFLTQEPGRVVYWGTSGQRIAESYFFDHFCMEELLQNGRLLAGEDQRRLLPKPGPADFYRDVRRHCEAIQKCAQTPERSLYSFGWLLDIARGIYTLRNGKVASKTVAAQWVLDQGLCPVPDALQTALKIRGNPMAYREDPQTLDAAQTLGAEIRRFANALEQELDAVSDRYKR